MSSAENILKQITKLNNNDSEPKLPPVDSWNPDFCGDMNMQIKTNGEWWHEGTPIGRKKLFKLFSTIIKKEKENYFLVTPVEKIGIQVDWQPFVIVDFEIIEIDGVKIFQFFDNCDNRVLLKEKKQLQLSYFKNENLPTINIRRNLFASFTRNCYYRLIEIANLTDVEGATLITIQSNNKQFLLGEINEDSL